MATYRVFSGAAGANNGTSWTDAYTTFGAAVTAATTNGDIILVHYTHQESLAADTPYTFAADVLIFAVDKDSGDVAAIMGTGGWIGHSSSNRAITLSGTDRRVYGYGLTFRIAGSTTDNLIIGNSTGFHGSWEQCYLWQGNTNSGAIVTLCGAEGAFNEYRDCTFRFGHASQNFVVLGPVEIIGGSVSSAGTAPSTLFDNASGQTSPSVVCRGLDAATVTGTLVGDMAAPVSFTFDRCRLGSGVTPLASQTSNPTGASASVLILDCANGDTHGLFGFHNAFGSVVSDTGIYYTSGAAGQSWKVVTSSLATTRNPFATPWIDYYNASLTSLTPRLEILRDGSATAYTDAEVWAETMAKDTSGSTRAFRYQDGILPNATPAAQANGAGLGSWTGESGTAWSGKIDSGSAIAVAEVGSITMRVCVGAASATVYVDPFIRV